MSCKKLVPAELTACLPASHMSRGRGHVAGHTSASPTADMHTWLRLIAYHCHCQIAHCLRCNALLVQHTADLQCKLPRGPCHWVELGWYYLEIASFCGHLQKELNAMLSTVVFNLHIRIKYTACLASKAVGIQRPPRCCCQHGLQIVCQLLHCGVAIGHLVGNVNQTALLGHQVGAEYCLPRQPAV